MLKNEGERESSGLATRVVLFLASAAFLAYALVNAPHAQAVSRLWIIKPGIQPSGLANFEWHFDEGAYPWFAGRDFSPASSGPTVKLRAQAMQNLNTSYRYKLTKLGSCMVVGKPQWKNIWGGGEWVDIVGADLHYLHINPSFSGTTYSGSFQGSGSSATKTIGSVATSGSCLVGRAASPPISRCRFRPDVWRHLLG